MDPVQRLRRDARSLAGDPEALALFECLVEHRFDPALDTTFMSRVCGAPRAVRDRLAAKIGPLKDYFTQLRMAEAERLVRETTVPIGEIGNRVGYPVKRTFRRAFSRAHGVSPRKMREQTQPSADDGPPAPATTEPEADAERARPEPATGDDHGLTRRALAARLRRRCELGMHDPEAATELRFKLRRRYPRLDQDDTAMAAVLEADAPEPLDEDEITVILTPTGDWLEEFAANSAFRDILDLPEAEQRFALLHGLRLGNVAAFRQLHWVCRALLQSDVDSALRIARLGVELVEPHREIMGDEGDDWKALAWICLGRVQAHAGDFGGAEKSLGFAHAEVGGEDALEPWCELDLRRVEGLVKKCQRRYPEAERAMDRAVELGRQLEPTHALRLETVLDRLDLASTLGDAGAGLALVEELEQLIDALPADDRSHTLWRGRVLLYRARAHVAGGDERRARDCLKQAISAIAGDPECHGDRQVGVLVASVLHELARLCTGDELDASESLLRAAVEHYRRLRLPVPEAAAEAELAVVCALRGRRAEARRLAASAADFLDDLPPLHREAWQASRRLRALANGGAAASEDELRELLEELRRDLDMVAREIPGPQAMSAALIRRGTRPSRERRQ